jgi:hypothetical protein
MPVPTTKVIVREVSSYPWRIEATTEDGRRVLVYCKHDELLITVGDETLHGVMDPLAMARTKADHYATQQ